MNYIDIAVLALLILSLLFGLIGKAPKKIFKFILAAAAVACAYIFTGKALDFLNTMDSASIPVIGEAGKTVSEAISAKIAELLASAGDVAKNLPADAINGLIAGLLKVIVFWVLAIALIIVFDLVGGIIGAIVFRPCKKGTAVKTLGIFSALRTAVVLVAVLFPVFVFSPVLKQATNVTSLLPEGTDTTVLEMVEEQANGSKVLELTDKALSSGKVDVVMYTVKNDKGEDETRSIYQTIGTLPSLLKVAGSLSTSDDPIAAFTEMSNEELTQLFADPVVQEVVKGVVTSMAEEAGLDIDLTGVDISQEAETFIAIKDLKATMDAGEEFTEESMDNLVDALANSEMVSTLAESNPGMLADQVDEGTKQEIEDALAEKVTSGEMSEEDKEALMKLFQAQAN